MKKYYKVRLYRVTGGYYVIGDEDPNSHYEVSYVGEIIVSKKNRNCRECYYGLDIPVVGSGIKTDFDREEDLHHTYLFLPEGKRQSSYVVLRDNLSSSHLVTQEELLKYDFNADTNPVMRCIEMEMKFVENGIKVVKENKIIAKRFIHNNSGNKE